MNSIKAQKGKSSSESFFHSSIVHEISSTLSVGGWKEKSKIFLIERTLIRYWQVERAEQWNQHSVKTCRENFYGDGSTQKLHWNAVDIHQRCLLCLLPSLQRQIVENNVCTLPPTVSSPAPPLPSAFQYNINTNLNHCRFTAAVCLHSSQSLSGWNLARRLLNVRKLSCTTLCPHLTAHYCCSEFMFVHFAPRIQLVGEHELSGPRPECDDWTIIKSKLLHELNRN